MGKINDVCRAIAQQAVKMRSPCIKIIPVFPNSLEEWAKLYFIITEMTKKIQKSIGFPFLIELGESNDIIGDKPQCNKNGTHEIFDFFNKQMGQVTLCIHCGEIFHKTTKTPDQLKEHFKNLEFDDPRKDIDVSQF